MLNGRNFGIGIGVFAVLGVLFLIGSGQLGYGESIVLLLMLVLFVLPGLSRLTR